MPADCVERVVNTKTKEILYQKAFNSTSASQNCFRRKHGRSNATDSYQRGTGIGKPVADEEKKEFKIDLRVQGIPQKKAVYQDEDRTRRIKRLAHMLQNQSKEKALIRDLQKTDTFNPVSEESEKIIHNLGNVEYFQLCEVSAKTQCSSCAKCWAGGVVCCTCGNCLTTPQKRRGCLTKEKFDLLSIPYFVDKERVTSGSRHGTDEQSEYYQAKVSLRTNEQQTFRVYFLKDFRNEDSRDRKLQLGGRKKTCTRLDQLAREDKSYTATRKERERRQDTRTTGSWLSTPRDLSHPMDKREDYLEAVKVIKNLRQ